VTIIHCDYVFSDSVLVRSWWWTERRRACSLVISQ